MNAMVKHLSVLLAACSLTSVVSLDTTNQNFANSRIVGGHSADNITIPFIVSLQSLGTHFCGGSIINERTILTAAHCIAHKRAKLVRVHLGSKSNTISDGELVPVESLMFHDKFTKATLDFDIGLVRLSRSISFGESIQPIPLADVGESLPDGTYAMIAGWGFTSQKPSELPNMLRYAFIPVVNQNVCNKLLGGEVTENMFCAGFVEGGVDACQMDSGGPLAAQGKLYGIVSWGEGCAEPNKPGVYTQLSVLRSWVDETMAKEYNEQLPSKPVK